MPNLRKYFYKEKGKTKKYVYCTFCSSGPYKQNEKDTKFLERGTKRTPLNICKNCATFDQIEEFRENKR